MTTECCHICYICVKCVLKDCCHKERICQGAMFYTEHTLVYDQPQFCGDTGSKAMSLCCGCCCYRRRRRMILRSARAAHGRRTSSLFACPRSLWCRSTNSAGHRDHKCSADFTSSLHNRQTASSEIPTKCCPGCDCVFQHAARDRDVDLTIVQSVPPPGHASQSSEAVDAAGHRLAELSHILSKVELPGDILQTRKFGRDCITFVYHQW